MQGIASHTSTRDGATLSPMKKRAMGDRKNMCIRYMPKLSLEISKISLGVRAAEPDAKAATEAFAEPESTATASFTRLLCC